MNEDSTVVRFPEPDEVDDPLTAVLRSGACRLLAQAIEAEAEAFLATMADHRRAVGRARFVRHGHGPERAIQTGIGPLGVQRVKVRDRAPAESEARVRFTSQILPRWARRTTSLEALLPVLYLRGVSTGDFQEALAALLGKDTPNLPPSVIARLKDDWQADYQRWQKRDLAAWRYVYVWADGVYLQARLEPQAECMLVIIGATPEAASHSSRSSADKLTVPGVMHAPSDPCNTVLVRSIMTFYTGPVFLMGKRQEPVHRNRGPSCYS
jgi:putative transposase